MRIIVANYRYFVSGGPETYMFNFMDLARQNNCEVIPFSVNYSRNVESKFSEHFAAPPAGEDAVRFDEYKRDIRSLFRIATKAFYNLDARRKLNRLIDEEKPDLLYIIHPSSTLSPSIISSAKSKGIPVIHRISDFSLICPKYLLIRDEEICELCIKGKYRKALKYRCVKGSFLATTLRVFSMYFHKWIKLYDKVDAFLTPANFTREKLIEAKSVPEDKIFVNPTFIDSSDIRPNLKHENYVLCLGRLSEEKGFIYAIEAMKYLKDTPLKMIITGNLCKKDQNYIKIIKDNDIEGRIQFVGFIRGEKLTQLISNAMCIISPSIWYENMPNIILESFAYGKPVLASDLGSYKDVIDHKVNGLLFEVKNTNEIAEHIRCLYEEPNILNQLSKNARNKVENEYNPKQHWLRFMEIFESIKYKDDHGRK